MRIGFYPFLCSPVIVSQIIKMSTIYIVNHAKIIDFMSITSIMDAMLSRIVHHNNKTEKYAEHVDYVVSIPADEVCVVNLGGTGIKDDEYGRKLGNFTASEILSKFKNVANYAIIYNLGPNAAPHRKMQFEKNKQNIIPKKYTNDYVFDEKNTYLYITAKNIDSVFKREIIPALRDKLNLEFKYIVDGDVNKFIPIIEKKLKQETAKLNYTPSETARILREHKKRIFSYQKFFVPTYLDDLFNRILLPRITDKNGKRLPIDIAKRQIRKITFLGHCHGGYVILMMEERLQSKMRDLGYSNDEINQVLSQMLTVALNPTCPLNVAKSQFISFTSLYDNVVERPENWIGEYTHALKYKNKNLKPGFLDEAKGNVFFVNNRFNFVANNTPASAEHNDAHFFHSDLTHDGKTMMLMAYNIIISGIKNSLMQDSEFTPLPPIDELILDGKHDKKLSQTFIKMKQNGNDFMKSVYKYATKKIHNKQNNKLFSAKAR